MWSSFLRDDLSENLYAAAAPADSRARRRLTRSRTPKGAAGRGPPCALDAAARWPPASPGRSPTRQRIPATPAWESLRGPAPAAPASGRREKACKKAGAGLRKPAPPEKTPASAVWAASMVPCAMAGGIPVFPLQASPLTARGAAGACTPRNSRDPWIQLSGTRSAIHHAIQAGEASRPCAIPPLERSLGRPAAGVNATLRTPGSTRRVIDMAAPLLAVPAATASP